MVMFIPGPKGDKGDKGDPGPKGDKGDQGDFDATNYRDRIQNDADNPNNEVICDTNVITIHNNQFNCSLDLSNPFEDAVLTKRNNILLFAALNTIVNKVLDLAIGEEIIKSLVECQDTVIQIQIGTDIYYLDLSNGSDGAPLVKNGDRIMFDNNFGKANIHIAETIPNLELASENTLYFAYDPVTAYPINTP